MPAIAFYPYKEDLLLRSMRVKTWFIAVQNKSGWTTRELEERFREDDGRKVKRSCIWNKYSRGEVVPRSGYRRDGRPNVLEQVEAAFPGTASWLLSPIWRLADKTPMEMSEIRAIYAGLPSHIRPLFVAPDAKTSDRFWRSNVAAKTAYSTLLRTRDLDAFTAVLGMVKEAEIVQSRKSYKEAITAAVELMEMFKTRSSFPLVDGELFSYLTRSWGLWAV